MQSTKGLQQTRTRLTRAHLECGDGFLLKDAQSQKPLLELTTSLTAPGHGYVVLELFKAHDVLYRIWISDELLNSEVTLDKLIKLFINKLAMETALAARLKAIDSHIDIETDEDEENVVLLWLDDTCIAEFTINNADATDVDIHTDLQGRTIKIQVADIFRRAIQEAGDTEDDVK